MNKPIFQFGNVVIVDHDNIGVIIKIWNGGVRGYNYDVYVRNYNGVKNYNETDINHFIFSKELTKKELQFYY